MRDRARRAPGNTGGAPQKKARLGGQLSRSRHAPKRCRGTRGGGTRPDRSVRRWAIKTQHRHGDNGPGGAVLRYGGERERTRESGQRPVHRNSEKCNHDRHMMCDRTTSGPKYYERGGSARVQAGPKGSKGARSGVEVGPHLLEPVHVFRHVLNTENQPAVRSEPETFDHLTQLDLHIIGQWRGGGGGGSGFDG